MEGFSGYQFGDRMVQLWGSERDVLQSGIGIQNKVLNTFLYRKRLLNTFRMNDTDMLHFVNLINSYKPTMMLAYVQSAYELACFVERNKLSISKMKGIITSAGTLYDDFRNKIESVFHCPVFNFYGSRETGAMAMECSKHEGLHLNLFGQYMEILNNSDQPVLPDEMGRIITTSLTSYTMPLIRFDIGDLAIASSHICSCGMGLPLIKNVKGRTVNVFRTKGGTLIDGEYFTHLFYSFDFIRQFQVVQVLYDKIVVKYVVAGAIGSEVIRNFETELRNKIELVMGTDCQVAFESLEEIQPTDSGKFVYTISLV
jgi:phenylacetate-CoA ligase